MKKTVVISFEIEEFKSILNDAITSSIKENKLNYNRVRKDPELFSRKEALVLFGITAPTLRDWVKKGTLPKPIRKGRRIYFIKEEIYQVLNNRRSEAIFCSIECGYTYRNRMKLDKRYMHSWESVYAAIITLINNGIYKMELHEFSKLDLRISETENQYEYVPRDKLVFELFDVVIKVRKQYVEFKFKDNG